MATQTAHEVDVEALRREAAALLRAQMEDGWNAWVHGAASHQAELYAQHPALFSRENVAAVAQAQQLNDGGNSHALAMFRLYLEREIIGKQMAALQDELTNREGAAEVTWDGKPLPFRQVTLTLAHEDDPERRRRLFKTADAVYAELNPLRRQTTETAWNGARSLGYSDYLALSEAQRKVKLRELRATCAALLETTRPLYTRLLRDELQRELGTDSGQFFRWDTNRLLRSGAFDRLFPQDKMHALLDATLRGLGIEVAAQSNILLDLEARPRKIPRAVMFAIDAPSDIRVSIKPVGGIDDYAALFHEMGHAEHFANTRESEWEFRNVGASNTVTETFAFLLEHVLDDEHWQAAHLEGNAEELRRFRRSRGFRRVFMLRRYCAKLEYEIQLHSQVADAPQLYSRLLSSALLYQREASEELRYLADVDELFYSADYLRAWFLEAQLVAELRRRFGPRWFERAEAGAYLKEIWSAGQKFSGEEFVRHFALPEISPGALVAEMERLAA